MIFSNISYLNENFDIISNAYIKIKDKLITYIGDCPPVDDYEKDEIYDGKNKLLVPSFINNHCHVAMTLLRGYGEGLPLSRWLNEKIFPFEDNLNSESVFYGSLIGIAEMIKSGCVNFSDMYFFCEDTIKAVDSSGVKINLAKGVTCFDDSDFFGSDNHKITNELIENFNNSSDGRIKIDACIHAIYTTTEKVIKQVAEYAKSLDLTVHLHLSETQKEIDDSLVRHGMTPPAFFEKCGMFNNNILAAHCVHLTDEDFNILKRNNINIAYCPSSNLKLGSGFADITRILNENINLTIGTDGASSNNQLNLLKEIQLSALIEKGRTHNPSVFSNKELLKAATINGAISQNRPNLGVVKENYHADLTVFDLDKENMMPCFDILSNIIYAASTENIVMTICDGKILYKDGEYLTIDIEKAKFQMKEQAHLIAEKTVK